MRPKVALLLSVLMAGGLVLLAVGSRMYYQRAAVEHFQREIHSAEEQQVPQLLAQLAALGTPGIQALAANLNSPRQCVALSARWLLLEQLARWRDQPSAEVLRRHLVLAEALAGAAPQFGPIGRDSAEQLAVRMLLDLPDGDSAQRQQLIDHCRRVLEQVGATAWSFKRRPLPEWDIEPAAGGSEVPEFPAAQLPSHEMSRRDPWQTIGGTTRPLGPEAIPAELARLPGGGLPLPSVAGTPPGEPLSAHKSASQVPSDGKQPETDAAQRLYAANGAAQGPSAAQSPQQTDEQASKLLPPEKLPPPGERPKAIPKAVIEPLPGIGGPIRRLADGEALGAPTGQRPLQGVSAGERLQGISVGEGTSGDSEGMQQHTQRFNPVEAEIARRLADPDPEARKQLVRLLPELQAVDPLPWLLRLCEDVDAEVRREAMTLLATSGDPAVVAQVRRLAQQDVNPRIRQLAERLQQR